VKLAEFQAGLAEACASTTSAASPSAGWPGIPHGMAGSSLVAASRCR